MAYVKDLQFSTTNIVSINQAGDAIEISNIATSTANSGNVYFCSANNEHVANDNNSRADLFKYSGGSLIRLSFASIITEITDAGCEGSFFSNNAGRSLFINDAETSLIFRHRSLQLHPLASAGGGLRNLYRLNFNDNSVDLLSLINGASFGITYQNGGLAVSNNHEKLVILTNETLLSGEYTQQFRAYIVDLLNDQFSYLSTPVHSARTLNANAHTAKMSDDQYHIYFATRADNVVPNQELGEEKLFYFNRLNGTTTLVTENYSTLNESSENLDTLDVSPSGRFAVYINSLNNRIELYDNQTDQYTQVTTDLALKPKVNDDGNVVYYTFNTGFVNIWDRQTQITEQVSVNTSGNNGNGFSFSPDIAGSGLSTWITFASSSTDLIANDDNGATSDIFMINWPNGNIFRVSEVAGVGSTQPSFSPVISSDTTTVVYQKYDFALGDELIKYDRTSSTLTNICKTSVTNTCDIEVYRGFHGVSNHGRYVSYSPDFHDSYNVYLYDSVTDSTSIIATPIGFEDNKFMAIGIDDSFVQPKLGVLFTQNNLLLNDLYGIENIAGGVRGNGFISGFLYQQGGDGETLNLNFQGIGQVFGGLNCQADCSFAFDIGTQLTLSVIEPPGQTFNGWEGDCINQSSALDFDCEVIMDLSKTITANFIETPDLFFSDGFEG